MLYIADLVYVCGGFDGSVRHTSMERYDPTIDQWTMLASMSTGREGAGLVVANDMLYCIGGYDGLNLLNSAERYDPNTGQWTLIASMSTRRSGSKVYHWRFVCAFFVNDRRVVGCLSHGKRLLDSGWLILIVVDPIEQLVSKCDNKLTTTRPWLSMLNAPHFEAALHQYLDAAYCYR